MTMDVLIYALCLGLGLLFTLMSIMVEHVFGDRGTMGWPLFDPGVVEGAGKVSGATVGLWSPTLIASFVMGFGGVGLVVSRIELTSKVYISLPLAIAGGCVVGLGVSALCRRYCHAGRSADGSVATDPEELTGTVVTAIPESGQGEIVCLVDGARQILAARTENGMPLAVGRRVRLTRMEGAIGCVEEIG